MSRERFIPVDSIPKPPPEEWHEQDGGWEKDGYRVEPNDGVWVVQVAIDEWWGGPLGTYATAEEAMQAADDETFLPDQDYWDSWEEDGTSHKTWQHLNSEGET
jgi:hypothetical protein